MIAVMGAAGNVGSKVADRLLREERQVRVLEHRRKLDASPRGGRPWSAATPPAPATSGSCSTGPAPPFCSSPRTWPPRTSPPAGPG